jgi:hypothetical protein
MARGSVSSDNPMYKKKSHDIVRKRNTLKGRAKGPLVQMTHLQVGNDGRPATAVETTDDSTEDAEG